MIAKMRVSFLVAFLSLVSSVVLPNPQPAYAFDQPARVSALSQLDTAWAEEAYAVYEQRDLLPPREDAAFFQAFDELHDVHYIPYRPLRGANPRILRQISRDPVYAKALVDFFNQQLKKDGKEPYFRGDQLVQDSRTILSRMELPNLVAGQVLTDAELRKQAEIMGLRVEKADAAYRFDSRGPDEVRQGFFPNPRKAPMTLVENVAPGADGGANFVSTTLTENNRYIMRNDYFRKAKLKVKDHPREIKAMRSRLPEGATEISAPVVFGIYEYRFRNLKGVKIVSGGIEKEVEFTTNKIESSQVESVRKCLEIIFRVRVPGKTEPMESKHVIFEPWEPFSNAHDWSDVAA